MAEQLDSKCRLILQFATQGMVAEMAKGLEKIDQS